MAAIEVKPQGPWIARLLTGPALGIALPVVIVAIAELVLHRLASLHSHAVAV